MTMIMSGHTSSTPRLILFIRCTTGSIGMWWLQMPTNERRDAEEIAEEIWTLTYNRLKKTFIPRVLKIITAFGDRRAEEAVKEALFNMTVDEGIKIARLEGYEEATEERKYWLNPLEVDLKIKEARRAAYLKAADHLEDLAGSAIQQSIVNCLEGAADSIRALAQEE